MVAPDEWNRIAKRLEMLESLLEAQRIEARNDADASWVTSAEMCERLTRRGVAVGSEADDSQQRRQFHAALLASALVKQVKSLQSADRSQRRLIQVRGKPVSQTLIEERRCVKTFRWQLEERC